MTDLTPLTALGSGKVETFEIGAFTLREKDDVALASLSCADTISVLGMTLPSPGKMVCNATGKTAIWIGQNQWMIAAEGLAETDFATQLRSGLDDPKSKVTEQTDGWVVFEITAADAGKMRPMLEHLINLPLSATAKGCAVRTLVHHMSVLVCCPDNDRIKVFGLRSYAESLRDVLCATIQKMR